MQNIVWYGGMVVVAERTCRPSHFNSPSLGCQKRAWTKQRMGGIDFECGNLGCTLFGVVEACLLVDNSIASKS